MDCHLQPKTSKDELCGLHGTRLKIRITPPPVDGKANANMIKFLAKQFGVAKNAVTIVKGELARQKRVKIQVPERIPENLNIENL